MRKLNAGLMTSLPESDPRSTAAWGSKRIDPRPQSRLCLTWSGCFSKQRRQIDVKIKELIIGMLKLMLIDFFCLIIVIAFKTRLFVHYLLNCRHFKKTIAAFFFNQRFRF